MEKIPKYHQNTPWGERSLQVKFHQDWPIGLGVNRQQACVCVSVCVYTHNRWTNIYVNQKSAQMLANRTGWNLK